jgi:hypothetical protein
MARYYIGAPTGGIPKSARGTSSKEYGQVSPTGKVEKTPSQIAKEAKYTYARGSSSGGSSGGGSSSRTASKSTKTTIPSAPKEITKTNGDSGGLTQQEKQALAEPITKPTETITQDKPVYGEPTRDYWGSSSAKYGQVSQTGKVEKTPAQISREASGQVPTLSQAVSGTYTAAKPRPSFVKDTPLYLKDISQRMEYKAQKEKGVKAQTYQAGAFAVGAAAGFTYPIIYPVQFAKGTYAFGKSLVTDPFGTGAQIKQELTVRPSGFFGELGGTMAFGKVVPKLAKPVTSRLPKPKITTFELPTAKGKTTLYKGISIEYGSRGHPLVGFSGGKIKFGTPKVDITQASKPFILETPSQTKIFQKALSEAAKPTEAAKFKTILDITRATEKTPSKFVQKSFVTSTKTLKPKSVSEILNFARKEKAQVYGSFAARQQMPKELSRLPADIDVQLKVGSEAAALKAKQLTTKLQKMGEPVRISKQTPTLIEVKTKTGWHHAVDIHSIDQALSDASPSLAGEKAYGLQLGQKSIKIEGVETMRLSEQGVRKMASISTARPDKLTKTISFAPEPHRIKDIGDWFTTQEVLLKSKPLPQTSALAKLQQAKSFFPKDVFKVTTPSKTLIYSPPVSVPKTYYPSISLAASVSPSVPLIRRTSLSGFSTKKPSIESPARIRKSPSTKLPSSRPPIYPIGPSPKRSHSPSPRSVSLSSIYSYKSPSPKRSPSPYKGSPSPFKYPSPKPSPSPSPSPYSPSYYSYPSKSPSPYSPSYYSPVVKTPPAYSPPIFRFYPKYEDWFTQRKTRKFTPRYKYQPSLVAGINKIVAFKKPKKITGLEIRPVVRL